MSYWVYILHSTDSDKYYIGQSRNPHRRLEFHNTIEKGYTSRYRPWAILYLKEYQSRQETIKVEKMIKDWKSKEKIRRLIEGEIIV